MIPPLKKSTYIYSDAVSRNGVKLGRPRGSKNSRTVTKRPKGSAPRKKKSKRGPGNHQTDAPLTPQVSKQIAAAWLIGTSLGEIAERVGVHKSALSRHVERHLVPVFRSELAGEALRITGLLREAARVAWQRVLADRDDANSLRLFSWSVDNLLSISGARSPLRIDVGTEYRVAGQSAQQLETSMLSRLATRIEDLRNGPALTVDADSHQTLEE